MVPLPVPVVPDRVVVGEAAVAVPELEIKGDVKPAEIIEPFVGFGKVKRKFLIG